MKAQIEHYLKDDITHIGNILGINQELLGHLVFP
jgi:hypothetical protein